MARTTGAKNGITLAKLKEVGINMKINDIAYDRAHNRVIVRSSTGASLSISSKKAGGDKEMFLAAIEVQKHMNTTHKKPTKDELSTIYKTIINIPSTKRKYIAKVKKDRSLKAFGKVIDTSVAKGIITAASAASKIMKGHNTAIKLFKSQGLDIDHRYFSYLKTAKDEEYIDVRITTSNGLQRSKIYLRDFSNIPEMIAAADMVRRHILINGKLPTENKKSLLFAKAVSKTDKILNSSSSDMLRTILKTKSTPDIKSGPDSIRTEHFKIIKQKMQKKHMDVALSATSQEINATLTGTIAGSETPHSSAPSEQHSKLKNPGILSKFKGWLLG